MNNINTAYDVARSAYKQDYAKKNDKVNKKADKEDVSVQEVKAQDTEAVKAEFSASVTYEKSVSYENSVSYEKGDTSAKKPTYTINKMSEKDREALVEKLKADQEARAEQFRNLIKDMLLGQAKSFSISVNSEDIWKFLAKGEYEVDEETRKKAQEEISEEGYYGIENTAQRIFEFASALAGDDKDRMKLMQEAFAKGFGQAEELWGGELPEISQKTKDRINELFDNYFNPKEDAEASDGDISISYTESVKYEESIKIEVSGSFTKDK